MVFPKPEELQRRSAERFREMGKEVPANKVNEMIGLLTVVSLHLQKFFHIPTKKCVVANSIITLVFYC